MMRGTRLRRALRGRPCKQALRGGSSAFTTAASGVPPHSPTSSSSGSSSSSSSSSKSSNAVGEPTANKGAAQEATAARRVVAPRRSEWRPSEAHRESATSIARKENAHLKAATTSRAAGPAAAMDGTGKPKSAGLRRRKLLGGAEYVPSPAQVAAASGVPSPASSSTAMSAAVAAAAVGEAGTPSVVSFSATTRFRARQALERLAAAGDAEAIEALRASAPPSTSASGRGDSTTGGGSGGDGGGLTPSTVLPLLLALVGAGYCVVNDLVPQEWLSWTGIDGGGGGVGGGRGSGDPNPASGTRAGDESSLSPLLRTLSGVAAFVPMASSTPKTSTDGRGGGGGSEAGAASITGAATGGAGTGETGPEGKHQAGEGRGWSRWGWWTGSRAPDGANTPPPAGSADKEGETAVLLRDGNDLNSDCGSPAVAAGEEGHRGEGQGSGARPNEEPSEHQQQQPQQPPRWLRWGAPPPASAPSASS